MDEISLFTQQQKWYRYHIGTIILTILGFILPIALGRIEFGYLGTIGIILVGITSLKAGRTALLPKGYKYFKEVIYSDGAKLDWILKSFIFLIIFMGAGMTGYLTYIIFYGMQN